MRRHPYEPPNQKMVYSFSNGQVQTPHPVYAPLVEPISRPEQSLQLSFHSQPHFQTQPPSNSNSELRITKDIKNVKEEYYLFYTVTKSFSWVGISPTNLATVSPLVWTNGTSLKRAGWPRKCST